MMATPTLAARAPRIDKLPDDLLIMNFILKNGDTLSLKDSKVNDNKKKSKDFYVEEFIL
jgi:hypothetical protein